MCKASVVADESYPAEKGAVYGVGVGLAGLGQLHPLGEAVDSCAFCAQSGAKLQISGINPMIASIIGVNTTEEVTFIETPGSMEKHMHDLVQFDDHPEMKPVPLAMLASDNTRAEVTFVPVEAISPLSLITAHDVVPVEAIHDEEPAELAENYRRESVAV